ncbi:MAG: metal ABC transporter substrate-binding protein [Lachnospiraceae bacterium]
MKKKLAVLLVTTVTAAAMLTGCGGGQESAAPGEQPAQEPAAETVEEVGVNEPEAVPVEEESTEDAAQASDKVVLKCVCDLTPHSEILNAAADQLAQEGIELDIVSTTWDATWNDMLIDGDIDFAYFMHVPAMESIEEEMGATLYSMGGVHVEPYACFSDKYASKDELPENAVIAIPNDSSNEYRALKVLEKEGFLKLNPDMTAIDASVDQIEEYTIPIEIVEMDQANIIPSAADFDAYFVNVNRALEANIDTTAYLMREGEDSEYANIITVTEANKDNEAIKKLVSVLQSDETKKFIEENFNGAVIPAKQ